MAITKEQALTATRFHDPGTRACDSKRGPIVWRRNGATKTWKRDPERWQVPVKFGMYDYGYINNTIADGFHVEEDCPALQGEAHPEGM